nr:CocE/NonD family hydrolase [uncultured Hyphomonas sp.]
MSNPPVFTSETEELPFGRPLYEVRKQRSVLVPMRDGVRLSTDLYFPEGLEGPLPVILVRSPYDKRGWRVEYYGKPGPLWFASQGYVVAVQDKRGKFESEGQYSFCGGDVLDTEDTVNWLVAQDWSSGKVGMFGCSYLGEIQIRHAHMRNPHVAAICPHAAGGAVRAADGRYSNSATRTGGCMELAQMLGWFFQYGSKVTYHPSTGADADMFARTEAFFSLAPKLPEIDLGEACRHLPTIDVMNRPDMPPSDWVDFMTRELSDPWWKEFGFLDGDERFVTPGLHVNNWYDYGVAQTIDTWKLFQQNADTEQARDNQYLVLSPMNHCHHEMASERTILGERDIGDARFDFHSLYFRWFERWLKGDPNAMDDVPKVQYFVMGQNIWKGSDVWPPNYVKPAKLFLHSEGRANSCHGDGLLDFDMPGDEPEDSFVYDPAHPVPSRGGPVCTTGQDGLEGAFDQSVNEVRQDVLVYSTEPLVHGIEISGPVTLDIAVSSSAPDTDISAKLIDVYPDGRAFNIQEGIMRLRYREGFEKQVFMEKGKVYRARVDLQETSNWFAPGHRIRIEVSSSSFPRFDRNMNTGGRNFDETEWQLAHNSIHHSADHPSWLNVCIREDED